LLSDTVGFIRKLPTFLIEAFKSTLDEVREADILLHVVDVSHPSFEDHIKVVKQTLTELKAADKPTILVFNKMDLFRYENEEGEKVAMTLEGFKNSYIAKDHENSVFISAAGKKNIDELRQILISNVRRENSIRYPYIVM
jgi:GTP-binding protein HflX